MSNTKVDVGITRCVIFPYPVCTNNVDISMVNYLRMAHQMHTGNMPPSGMRTDGEQTLRKVGHSSPDLCRVKKEKRILNS